MSLTIHFIDKNWDLHRWTPYVAPFSASHTGKNISIGLDAMIEELGLAGGRWELFAVNDNVANAKLGVKLSGYLNQYLCVIHTRELATKDTSKNTPGMKDLSKKTKKLGRFAHKSTLATKELKRECRKKKYSTRWSGMHKNFTSVLHLKKALVNLTSCRVNWHVHSLTPAKWKLLEGAVKMHLEEVNNFETTKHDIGRESKKINEDFEIPINDLATEPERETPAEFVELSPTSKLRARILKKKSTQQKNRTQFRRDQLSPIQKEM